MDYDSSFISDSQIAPGVQFHVWRISYGRRIELLRRIRDLAQRQQFHYASDTTEDKMESRLLEGAINRLYILWGLKAVTGLTVDGAEATPEVLTDSGPEDLFREALELVKTQLGLSVAERKN